MFAYELNIYTVSKIKRKKKIFHFAGGGGGTKKQLQCFDNANWPCIVLFPESIVPYETTLKWNFNKSQFTSVTMAGSDIYNILYFGKRFQRWNLFFPQFYSFRSIRNFANLRVPRITMTTPLVNIQFVALKWHREGEGKGERERETRQIRYTGIAAATRAARGVRPFIGGCPALLSTPLSPSASQHPRTPSSFSLFRSPLWCSQASCRVACTLSGLQCTRDVLDTFNDHVHGV